MSPDRGKSRSGLSRRAADELTTTGPSAADPSSSKMPVLRKPPPTWVIRFAAKQALREWHDAHAAEPELMAAALHRLRHKPLHRGDNPRRTGPLHGALAERTIGGNKLPQWQHELTSAGRLWYCPDKKARVVWVTKVSLKHPRATS